MSEFTKAADRAATEICRIWDYDPFEHKDEFVNVIAKHYADLAATHEKLVELANTMKVVSDNRGAINLCKTVGMAINPEWIDKSNAAEQVIRELLADPRIQRAIGGVER